ncbi:MAG: response regulator transcription factor [Candidatus Latescibacterota bacterium]
MDATLALPRSREPSGKHILIVDDESAARTTWGEYLQVHGFRVTAVACAEEALALVPDSDFAVAVVDLLLPGRSGLQFLGDLRHLKRRPPVVVVSGHVTPEDAARAAHLGALVVISKPCGPRRLLVCVRRILGLDLHPCVGYLTEHFASIRCEEEVAAHFHVHRHTIARHVEEETGQEFGEFLAELRVEEAKRLLALRSLPIDQIRERVGCASMQVFDRVFRRHTGITPSEYRDFLRQEEERPAADGEASTRDEET